ncbi:MAG: phosphoenolpyruvate synthase [Deltaproteobacteria bacterium]|nr:MAG: phosphoenolpyruvate synthase [Deltaproteobacteria bacterium]
MLYSFNSLPTEKKEVGGKAYMLAMMTQMGLKVPEGWILDAPPQETERDEILGLIDFKKYSLAVRSSATGEDSKEHSFAGQNSTFLYVDNETDLFHSIQNCFESIQKESSKSYRKHFLGSSEDIPMNVVIQRMIDPAYSGVYFSKDPRGKYETWMLEYIDGVGEDLVSGKRTPIILSEANQESEHLTREQIQQLLQAARLVEEKYQDDFDMEWAIDKNGDVFILQARPITAKGSISNLKKLATDELDRLKKKNSLDTVWDGQTFAEWTVAPSSFTRQLWAKAFTKGGSFDTALRELGYLGFRKCSDDFSILDSVFGKSYINLNKLGDLYFGSIPYDIEPLPRPHLRFNFLKISAQVIFNTPITMFRMLKVGLSINTSRRKHLDAAKSALVEFSTKMKRPNDPNLYHDWADDVLMERIEKECHVFSTYTLTWPFILISLTETTLQTMMSLLKSIVSEEEASQLIKQWTGQGIKTETWEMGQYFKKACARKELRPMFLERYGHRGPGELDLNSKRWIELGEDAFYDLTEEEYKLSKSKHSFIDVEKEIDGFKTFKKAILQDEWKILKDLLELREKWKMALLKPFCHIRFLLLEKAKRLNLESPEDIFWLNLSEIKSFNTETPLTIKRRKEKAKAFDHFNFSMVTSLKEIEDIVEGKSTGDDQLRGEGLSPGLVKGTVVVVHNPENMKDIEWPENPILVAQSTDPGWTPLFIKSKGIIVERGGVLSHCAIVAREMGIPAVSGIMKCHHKFKGGENVWVDGNTGTIKLES